MTDLVVHQEAETTSIPFRIHRASQTMTIKTPISRDSKAETAMDLETMATETTIETWASRLSRATITKEMTHPVNGAEAEEEAQDP